MKIRLTEDRVSNGHMMWAGEVHEFDDQEAWSLIRAKMAEPIGPETTAVTPGRTAVLDKPQPRIMRGQKR